MGLSILSRGTMDEKLRWIFNLYDLNGDGKVTKEELLLVVSSMYDLMGKCTNPIIDDSVPKNTAEVVFKVNKLLFLRRLMSMKIIKFFYLFKEIECQTGRCDYN